MWWIEYELSMKSIGWAYWVDWMWFKVIFGTVLWRGRSELSECLCFMAAHVFNYSYICWFSTKLQKKSDVYPWAECICDIWA